MNKTIVCYFSATGTTKKTSETLSKILESDLFEIEPKEKYTNEDLDWNNKNSRSTIEMENENTRPEIKEKIKNINEYDNIIIGFPIWWYQEPRIIDTFIEENDLNNKNIYVFATSGGSTIEKSLNHLKEKYPSLNFVSGKTLNQIDEEEIKNWIK